MGIMGWPGFVFVIHCVAFCFTRMFQNVQDDSAGQTSDGRGEICFFHASNLLWAAYSNG
jgi:hypothetical protein